MRKSSYALGSALLALSMPAMAQTSAPDLPTKPSADSDELNHAIIVTANKRPELLQKTTSSITVTTGTEIVKRGKTSLDDVLRDQPTVELSNSGGGNIFIRGIGSTSDTMDGRDQAVQVTIDGVNQASNRILNTGLFDVERVEVAAGPQGTLYGRNATGGVINLVSVAPGHEFAARGNVQIGNYNAYRAEGGVTVPLDDTLAVRVASLIDRHSGYGSYGINAVDNAAVRIRPMWDPTEQLHILGTFEYRHQGGTPPQGYPLTALGYSNPFEHGFTGYAGLQDNTYYNASLQVDYKFNWAVLSLLPSYNRTHFYWQIPNPLPTEFAIPQFVTTPTSGINEQKTMEIHLASPSHSKIKWIAGLYYMDLQNNKTVEQSRLGINPYCTPAVCDPIITVPAATPSKFPTKSYAAFGQMTYPVTEKLRLTGGLRYTRDEKNGFYTDSGGNNAQYSLPFNNLSFSSGVEYDLEKESLLYVTVSSGYKAGGANVPDQNYAAAKAITKFSPEKLMAYTIGTKNTFLNGKLVLNLEAYYYDYKDFQFSATAAVPTVLGASQNVNCNNVVVGPVADPTSVCTSFSYIGNASNSKAYGAQLTARAQPTRNDLFNVALAYQHTRYGQFTYSVPGQGNQSYAGDTFINAPTWSATIGYEHDIRLASGAMIDGRVDARLSSKYNSSFDYRAYAAFTQPGYGKVDLSLGYSPQGRKWSLRGYVRNLTNIAVVESGSPLSVYLNDPRVFGGAFSFNF